MSDQGEIQSQEAPVAQAPVEERLSALADRFRQHEPNEPPPSPSGEEAAPVEETQEETPEEPQGQPEEDLDLVDHEYKGKQLKVPKELVDGTLRQADYTRKTQEVAERRRVVEEREQMLMQTLQLSEQLAPALGQLSQFDQQIKSLYEQLTPQLEADDPIRFNTLGTRLSLLSNQRQQFAQGLQGHQQQLMQALQLQKQKAMQERLMDALPKVKSAIKDFSPEVGKQLAEYAKTAGFAQEEIEFASFSAPLVVSLWKAREFDRIKAAQQKAQPKPSLPPVAKPGSRNAESNEQSARAKETMQTWKKGGGKDADALAAILRQRLKGK